MTNLTQFQMENTDTIKVMDSTSQATNKGGRRNQSIFSLGVHLELSVLGHTYCFDW